jgi:hypothetical protein
MAGALVGRHPGRQDSLPRIPDGFLGRVVRHQRTRINLGRPVGTDNGSRVGPPGRRRGILIFQGHTGGLQRAVCDRTARRNVRVDREVRVSLHILKLSRMGRQGTGGKGGAFVGRALGQRLER